MKSSSVPAGRGELALTVRGKGLLHYVAAYSYALAGDVKGSDNGLRVTRVLQPLDSDGIAGTPLGGLSEPRLSANRLYQVTLRVYAAPQEVLDHLVITEHLPAGLEPVNGSMESESATFPRDYRDIYWQDQTVFTDHIVWYESRSWSGATVTYVARAVTSGSFAWPGADAHLEFAPEEFGRSAAGSIRIDR